MNLWPFAMGRSDPFTEGSETCPKCFTNFTVTVTEGELKKHWLTYRCPECGDFFDVENLSKLMWVKDSFSGTYYLSSVSKYLQESEHRRRFDYYEKP